MIHVYFLRHGIADRSEWSGDDFERPLTARGRSQMRREAETIVRLNLALEVILSSPLARACQTAEIVAEALGDRERFVIDRRLAPGFGVSALADMLAERPGLTALLLVGHEPDFSETISALIGGGRVVCKKGSLARVDLPDVAGAHAELVWLIPPTMLVS